MLYDFRICFYLCFKRFDKRQDEQEVPGVLNKAGVLERTSFIGSQKKVKEL